MKRYLVLPFFLAGCVTVEDRPRVVDYTGHTVTVEYAAPMTGALAPNAAIVEVARETCPGAQHLSSRPNSDNLWAALHLFRC